MSLGLSHALEELVRRRDQLKTAYDSALRANKSAHEKEADLEAKLKEEYSKTYLLHRTSHEDGAKPMSETDAKARADIETARLHRDYVIAKAVRRASAEALAMWQKDLEFLTASVHLTNRELKTLGG
jgi:hypothetical protein